MLKDLIDFAFGVVVPLHDRPTLVAVIRNVKLGGIATVPTKDRQRAWCVGGKRNAAIETACAVLVPAAIMVKSSVGTDGTPSSHVGRLVSELGYLLLRLLKGTEPFISDRNWIMVIVVSPSSSFTPASYHESYTQDSSFTGLTPWQMQMVME